MTTLNLYHIMNPKSLAVIGASEKKGEFVLGQKLGFEVKLDTESSEYKLEINLKDLQ